MNQLSTKLPLDLMQTKWASTLNPLLALPIVAGNQISNVVLTANKPLAINHLIQRMPQGWFLTDINANTAVWRTAVYTNTTITLESSANVTISLWVY
jgi:hypothetical protein